MNDEMDPAQLISKAKSGEQASLGPLLEMYRAYLRLLARIEIGQRLQGKVDASDLVQETLLDAHRNFDQFRGEDEPQFAGWLRQILAAKAALLVRHYFGTKSRDVRLEQDLQGNLNHSSNMLAGALAASLSSPSQRAVRREQGVLLANALERLPPDYREVLVLRHLQELSFPLVAQRMNRSLDSVEKLWVRALARLRVVFGEDR